MESEFFFQTAADDVLAMLQSSAPTNPFSTAAYVAARKNLGYDAGVVGIRNADGTLSASASYFKTGTLRRLLEVTSMSPAAESGGFGMGCMRYAKRSELPICRLTPLGPHRCKSPACAARFLESPGANMYYRCRKWNSNAY